MKHLIDEQTIQKRVAELGQTLSEEYRGKPLTIIGVLTGSIVLLADLIRAVDVPLRVGLVQASSYSGKTTTRGDLSVNSQLVPDLKDRDVLLIDDIFDTGHTMQRLYGTIGEFEPRSLKSAVLLWKQERTEVELRPDHYCFQIPNEFVVGYGLDYNDDYRHLPYIGVLEEDDL
ncbi:hypoxanthine phosphoribosyltransferase [bacterium]|nr:hypoxanthine phosphoribosyltransferase [bacterium]